MNTKRQRNQRMGQSRERLLGATAAGSAIFLLGAAGAAVAQEQDKEDVQEVVVTGLRKSIEASIGVKKNESSIVEVVSAEDIGKLPDASIAESIARLPGIAAQRTNGRAQTLSIRGLGPDFTVTTFNGREQASTNDNRTVEFDQYPSELVTQVKIYKTPDAGMSYQGIAGTTDIATVHPLSFNSRKLALGYKREMDEQSANIPGLPDAGNRASLTYIDQFADNKLGVAFGVAYNKTPYQAQTREPWGYADAGGGNKVIGGDKDGVQSSFYKRTAFMGVAEFQPGDSLHMLLDAYHSDFQELQTIQRLEYGTVWGGATLTNPGPVENGRVQSGDFPNVPFVVVENYNNDRHAKVDSIGLNTNFQVSDTWSINNDLSWSKVKRSDLRLESTAGLGSNNDPTNFPAVQDQVSFTTAGNGVTNFTPTLNYSDYGTVFLTDPGGWGGGERRAGFVGAPDISDEIKAIRLAATHKFGDKFFLSDVSFGVNYADRTKAKNQFQSNLWLTGNISHAAVPEQYRTGIADSSFFGSPYGIIGYDALAMYRDNFWAPINSIDDPNANSNDRINNVQNTWKVNEKLTTAYVKFDWDTDFHGLPFRGNVGVQSVTADQSSDLHFTASPIPANTPVVPITIVQEGEKYTNFLPSLNMSFDFPDDYKVRVGVADTVARPRLDELGGGASYTVTSDQATPPNYNGQFYYWARGGGGNPKLRPWRAVSYDLSIEKYFAEQAYVSFAAYWKDLKTYIINSSTLEDFSGVPLPAVAAGDPTTYTQADANRTGVSTLKVNGKGGYIKGVEFTASIPFSLFAEPLDGFGFIFSAAKNSSAIKVNGQEIDVPGLSTKILNSTLYYEKYGFSARISDRYRDKFLGEVPLFDATLSYNTVAAESLVDAQIGYSFQQGPMKGLSINLSGTNLTDEPFILSNVGDPAYDLIKYQKYGATYALSVNYVFQ